jgi:hypothetical protein
MRKMTAYVNEKLYLIPAPERVNQGKEGFGRFGGTGVLSRERCSTHNANVVRLDYRPWLI